MAKRGQGFSLLELLLVLGVLAILLGIAISNYLSLRRQLAVGEAAQQVAQDLGRCRGLALSQSRVCRLIVRDADRYAVELAQFDDPEPPADVCARNDFDPVAEITLKTPARFQGAAVGDCVAYGTRGYAHLHLSTPGYLEVGDGTRARRIFPSMVGAVRVVTP